MLRVLAALSLLLLALTAAPVAARGGDRYEVAPASDFATVELGDPWDYAEPSDILTDPNGPTLDVTGMQVAGGWASWSAGDLSYVSPHDMTVPGALPDSRDGVSNPIDADRYPHVGLRLWSSRRVAGGLQWFVCNDYSDTCFRSRNFTYEEGWNLYDLDLGGTTGSWQGDVLGLRLAAGQATDLRLDWLRVHDGGSEIGLEGPPPFTLERRDDTSVDGGDGRTRLAGGTLVTGGMPPGEWVVRDAADAQVAVVVVRDGPRPVVLDPDPTGGDDHATVVRGDPWDFSQAGDHGRLHEVRDVVLADGVLQATNTSDQPHVELMLGGPVDTSRFHRLTVTMTYDGEFDLGFGPGGGSHARVVFDPLGGDLRQPTSSKELVTYQDRPTTTWDLTSDLVGPAVEDGAPSWDAAPVGFLRFDPNEDRGARTWRLDDIRLAADDEADGTFPLRWRDPAHDGPTSVRIGLDDDRGGFDGALIEVPGGAGEQVAVLDVSDVRPGRRWAWVEVDDGVDVARAYARAPLRVTGRIAGRDRVATGVALSSTAFDRATVAVLASATSFPDALAGAALAAAVEGPILLTAASDLDPRVADELERLDVDEVLLLGGGVALSPSVEEAVTTLDGITVTRLAGPDRHVTSARIAEEARSRWLDRGVTPSDEVLLAASTSFPDALAAGQLAAATATPILLTTPHALHPAVADALDELDIAGVVAIGGPGALATATTDATGRPVRRLSGRDRYATAIEVAAAAVRAGANPDDVVLASGVDFPDALAAGPVVAIRGGTLLLVDPATLPPSVADRLDAVSDAGRVVVAGGRLAVGDAVLHASIDHAYGR